MKQIINMIKVLLVLSVMACIFYLSSQPATVSRALSNKVVQQLRSYIEAATWLVPSIKEAYLRNPVVVTRKLAHVAIYMVLGLVSYLALPRAWSVRKRVALVIMLCLVYAITDEFHQSFVPGRGPEIRDVLIDTLGSSIGMGIGMSIRRLTRK